MYETQDTEYCYPNSFVLINKFDIQAPTELEIRENMAVGLRFQQSLPDGLMNVEHFKALHFHLFQDVYTWAGQYRTVRISKNKSMFCYPENIVSEMNGLFDHALILKAPALSFEEFFVETAKFLSQLNAIHPFRDGNGRTQLAFLRLIADSYWLNLDLTRTNTNDFINAMIHSFHHDNSLLEDELEKIIIRQ